MFFIKPCFVLLLLIIGCIFTENLPIALVGTIITPNQTIINGTLLIFNENIIDVGAGIMIPKDAIVINTNGIILPGLIDLHNHLLWNVLPRWNPIEQFNNRYEWLDGSVFRTYLGGPYNALTNTGLSCLMQQYAEVKAITQGTTSTIGGLLELCSHGLVRNLDADPTLGKILYNVNPLQMTEVESSQAKEALASNGSLIVHLGEGSSSDAASKREFSMLEGRGFLVPGVSLVHGVALKPTDFETMAKANVGFIWSPRSNIELYGQTANVEAAKNSSVIMALAPDWSVTGSDGLLTELNFAATWNIGLDHSLFDDQTLVQMATTNPAKLVHLDDRIGSLKRELWADVLVLSPVNENQISEDPFWAITHSTPEDVTLVMVGGRPVYGDPTIMKKLTDETIMLESIDICGVEKSISFVGEFKSAYTFRQIEGILRNALRRNSRTLSLLSDCGT